MIIEKNYPSLERDVFPVLEKHGFNPRWYSADDGYHDAVVCDEGYVMICETDCLHVRGNKRLAEVLDSDVKNVRRVYFHPEEVARVSSGSRRKRGFFANLFSGWSADYY